MVVEHSSLEGFWPGWHIVGEIGSGAYGRVYRAEHQEFGQRSEAAVKVIDGPMGPDTFAKLGMVDVRNESARGWSRDMALATAREISVMQSLKGARNIVSVEDFHLEERQDIIGWVMWIRMELLESLPSYQMSLGSTTIPPDEVVRIGLHVCNALDACHGLGVVHRDVKPENIFRTRFGEYKLGDFGIAKQLDAASGFTATNVGTLSYMAPEVARGANYDRRVDFYSLGIVLYRYLNGMRLPLVPAPPSPVRPRDLDAARWRRLQGERLPAPAYADEHLAAIVLRACQADPDLRYSTARELADELELWMAFRDAGRTAGRHVRVPDMRREEGVAATVWGTAPMPVHDDAPEGDPVAGMAEKVCADSETLGRFAKTVRTRGQEQEGTAGESSSGELGGNAEPAAIPPGEGKEDGWGTAVIRVSMDGAPPMRGMTRVRGQDPSDGEPIGMIDVDTYEMLVRRGLIDPSE